MPPNPDVPGPTNREMLPQIAKIQSDPLRFLCELSDRYGDVARFFVFRTPVYVLSHPDGVRHVLQDQHRRYSKDTVQYNSLASITGRGLLTNDGADWLRQRRLAQPAFARPRLLDLDRIVLPAVERLSQRWEQAASSGNGVDVDREMMRLTLEVVGKALFSIDLSDEAGELTQAVITTLDHIVHRVRTVIVPPEWVPTPQNRAFRRALKVLDDTVRRLMEARRARGEPGDDLLGMFLAARDEETGKTMSDRQVRDEVMTMLVAGHETVASALTWTWMLLAQNPPARERLERELSTVLGGAMPSSAQIPALEVTGQTFHEALRLYPPAWVISRKAIEDDEVGGYPIPSGALVIISPYAVHRRLDLWPEPEAFRPERFAVQSTENRNRHAFIPFGAGPRLCIGNQFAQIEAVLILAALAQRFRLDLVGPAPAVESLVTLRPHGGLPMRILRR